MSETTVQWGGRLGDFLDPATGMSVGLRAFGTFVGTMPDPEAIKMVVFSAVRQAAGEHGDRGVLALSADPHGIARAAQTLLAPQLAELGASGVVSIAAISMDEEDAARLTELMRQAAVEKMKDR